MPAAPARPSDDDELDDLPPLDADEPPADPDYSDMVGDGDDADRSLDDSTAEDDPQDALETGEEESGWLVDAEDADDVEVDDEEIAAFDGANEAGGDFDELGAGDEDYGLGAGEEQRHLDGGEEGPSDADEDLNDDDLPALDADDEGEMDDAALVDSTFTAAPEIAIARAARQWTPTGAPLDVGVVRAIAVAQRGAIVAASGLSRVDLEGSIEPLAGPGEQVDRLAAGFGLVAAVTRSGAVALSRDDGASFEIVRKGERDLAARDVAVTRGALWVLRSDGALEGATHAASVWTRVAGAPRAIALAADGGDDVATLDEHGAVARHVGRGAPATSADDDATDAARAFAGATAIAVRGGNVLLAVDREADDVSWLVCLARVGESRAPVVVAELGAVARALAVDDAHGVVWVGGELGLVALEPPPE